METSPGLIRAMLRVWRVLDALGIRYCLIGGLAVSMLATPRATGDIDVAVIKKAEEHKKVPSDYSVKDALEELRERPDDGE